MNASVAPQAADRALRNVTLLHIAPWLAAETRVVLARAFATLGDGAHVRELLAEDLSLRRRTATAAPPAVGRAAPTPILERVGGQSADGRPALTSAELRALQYLPTHLTLKEIGERLLITRNTVKTHTIAIYRKLGSDLALRSGRPRARARPARQLGGRGRRAGFGRRRSRWLSGGLVALLLGSCARDVGGDADGRGDERSGEHEPEHPEQQPPPIVETSTTSGLRLSVAPKAIG